MPPGKRTHFYPEELTLRSDAKEEWHESTFFIRDRRPVL
jgi:hypothetical protein